MKRNADKLANTMNLVEENISLLSDAIVEVAQPNLKGLSRK